MEQGQKVETWMLFSSVQFSFFIFEIPLHTILRLITTAVPDLFFVFFSCCFCIVHSFRPSSDVALALSRPIFNLSLPSSRKASEGENMLIVFGVVFSSDLPKVIFKILGININLFLCI